MRTNRPYSLVALAVVVLLAASCGSDRIGTRYRAERALYKALRQEQNLRLDPARAPKVLEEYRRIVESIPLPAAESDTGYAYPIARLRSNAVNGMVKMHDRLGQSEKAQELLEQARKDYLWDPRIALRIYGDLIDRARARGDYGQVAGYCQEIAGSLPARDGHGRPTASPENGRVVLDSPLDAADALAQVGRRDEAFAELDRAEIYYRSVIDEAPDDQAAAVAWVDLGLTQLRRGHLEDAAASLDRAQRVPGAREMRARILFLMASLDEERKDYAGAANRLAELLDKEGKDPVAPRAAVKRAQMLARLDRQEEAIQLLETVKVNHPLQKDAQAEAELQAARIRAEQGRWNDAISYYIALQADFPTSPQALGAPFE
ncbi:MAG: tetratricopeptide repeat protein, partial [Candidatus Eisenbacteria bacterium]|nr:tetratricopeptide repeat protein [Candidatus Eisenbacteria bacterium]